MSALTTREVLTDDDTPEPVTIVTDPERPCWVRVELDGMAMEWTTDTDADTGEDMTELKAREGQTRNILWKEVARTKLVQSVRQALAVTYALRRNVTVTRAWDYLALEFALEDVGATEGYQMAGDVQEARDEAWGLLAAQLRTYSWVRHGDTLGAAKDAAATRVLDLMTGETWEVKNHLVLRDAKLKEMEGGAPLQIRETVQRWTDCNGVPIEDEEASGRAGEWWFGHGGAEALPFNPWEMERVQMV